MWVFGAGTRVQDELLWVDNCTRMQRKKNATEQRINFKHTSVQWETAVLFMLLLN